MSTSDRKPRAQTVLLAVLSVIAMIGLTTSVTGWPIDLRKPDQLGQGAAQSSSTCAMPPSTVNRKIVSMGDSLSTEYGASAPEKSWPVILKTQFAAYGWVFSARGIGSTMASQYLPGGDLFYVTDQVRNSHPDVLILNFRANEQVNGKTPDELKNALNALIDAIHQVSPETKILLWNPPLMWYHAFVSPQAQEAYIAKMYEVKTEKGTCWVDFRPFFPQSGPNNDTRKLLFDDIHYSNEAQAVIAAGLGVALTYTCG